MNLLRGRKAVLFDLDDTLIHYGPELGQVWPDIVASAGGAALSREQMNAAFNAVFKPIWGDIERQRIERVNMRKVWVHIMREAFKTLGLVVEESRLAAFAETFAAGYFGSTQCKSGTRETLTQLRQLGLKLGLITNGDDYIQRGKLQNCDLHHLFDYVQIEGALGIGKPDERAYRTIVAQMGCTASEALMVGDNLEFDVLAPIRLGIDAVWVTRSTQPITEISPRPLALIHSVTELLNPALIT